MKLRQKFMILACIMAFAIALVCAVSYHFASAELEQTTDSELRMTVAREATQLNGWLESKKNFGESTANVMTNFNGNMAILKTREILGTITSDKEILDMTVGMSDGYCYCYYAGDITGKLDPTTRSWFNNARDLDRAFFTAPYVDVNTNAYIISIGVPVKANGKFIAATCLDLSLETLTQQISKMNYHGDGSGIIIEANGNILATGQYGEPTKNFKEIDGLGKHFDTIVSKGDGYFEVEINGEDTVFAYTTVPATGWLIGITASADKVFAPLKNLRWMFGIFIVVGLLLAFGICLTSRCKVGRLRRSIS